MDKQEALRILFRSAAAYKEHLLGRSYLFAYLADSKTLGFLECVFEKGNFRHLTGIRTAQEMSAKSFFDRALRQRLAVRDIAFAANGTTPLKLSVLPSLLTKDLSVKMVGDYRPSHLLLCTDKLAGNIRASMGFRRSGARYVPNTVLREDIREAAAQAFRVVFTCRKSLQEERYAEVVYRARHVSWEELAFGESFSYLLDVLAQEEEKTRAAQLGTGV